MSDCQHASNLTDGQQPSCKWCFVCGVENPCGLQIRFFNDGQHRALARVTLGDEYQGYPGVAHGGILATILDETMGRAMLSEDGPEERFMFTARLELRYRQPVPLHREFTVRGRVDKDRGRTAAVSGEIVLADGTLAVEASATLVNIPREQIEQMKSDDIGWQVYP
jgi:acyl-coenzyme A thioesterase PaaI-like protein